MSDDSLKEANSTTNGDKKEWIIHLLEAHPEGLTVLDIAKELGIHRHTASKHVERLAAYGVVYQRKVGPAKLCYLKNHETRSG